MIGTPSKQCVICNRTIAPRETKCGLHREPRKLHPDILAAVRLREKRVDRKMGA